MSSADASIHEGIKPLNVRVGFFIYKEGFKMKKEIRNSKNKLVCAVDEKEKKIEIKQRDVTTVITVAKNGEFIVTEKNT